MLQPLWRFFSVKFQNEMSKLGIADRETLALHALMVLLYVCDDRENTDTLQCADSLKHSVCPSFSINHSRFHHMCCDHVDEAVGRQNTPASKRITQAQIIVMTLISLFRADQLIFCCFENKC